MAKRKRNPDKLKLRDMDTPTVLGYELDRETLTPKRRIIDIHAPGDYGCNPVGDGAFKMVPSGDIVDYAEMKRRLKISKI